MSNAQVTPDKANNVKNSEEVEDEEEDVPEDFFDDFLKNDFLAGLEVLDEDESPSTGHKTVGDSCEERSVSVEAAFRQARDQEDPQNSRSVSRERVFKNNTKAGATKEVRAKKPAKQRLGAKVEDAAVNKCEDNPEEKDDKSGKVDAGKSDAVKAFGSAERNGKESVRGKYSPGKDRRRERGRSRDKRRYSKERKRSGERLRKSAENEISKEKRRRSRSRSRQRENRSSSKDRISRRDPSKTMRDIQKDKVKCAKDKEAKIISEKLKVVETGLVPPGMEMEMDISEPVMKKRSPDYRKNEPYRRSRVYGDEGDNKRSRSRSIEGYRHGKYSRSPSPKSRRRYRSPSPPRREGEYRPRYRRSPLNDRRSEERRRDRRSKDRKPTFLEELDQKLNCHASRMRLEQIKDKINGVPTILQPLMVGLPSPVPPVPPINNMSPCFPQPVYDEQYFIGGPMHPQTAPPPVIIPPQPGPPINFPMHVPPPNYITPPPQQINESQTQKSMETLFKDENISLSAFLSITTRDKDHFKTMDLQDKVKTLSRCQDAIKLMTESSRQSGRFYYKGPLRSSERNVDFNNASPLKRIMPVRLNFTKRAKKPEEKASTPLELLLQKLGVKQPTRKTPVVVRESANLSSSSVQTESLPCGECEARKRVRTVSTGVQSVATTSDFACQVSEDDFLNTARSALKNILKNQSLAALTPAQLMSQLGGGEKEIFPAARKLSAEAKEADSEFHRNIPAGPRAEFNRRPQPQPQQMMPMHPRMRGPAPYQQREFNPLPHNPQFRPFYDPQNQFHRY